MKTGIYAGSFDPFTNGHLDILERASRVFDKVIVGVLTNSAKTPTFTLEERLDFIRRSVEAAAIDCEVSTFSGLLVDFAKERRATSLVRGLRAVTDFEYELQIASINKKLAPEIETIFLMSSTKYSYLSASIVREIGHWDGPIAEFVPPAIHDDIKRILHERR